MLFVDTSVWIRFFADQETSEVDRLTVALEEEEATIAFTGVILQEIMQGVGKKKLRESIEQSFEPFVEIFPSRKTYLMAAELYRASRKNGHQIRSSADCLIAACCIEHKVPLLTEDSDFKYLSEVSSLCLA